MSHPRITWTARQPRPAAITATPAQVERLQRRQLEKSVDWTGRERLRLLWYRTRLEAQEINYACRRMTELQMRLPDDWGQRRRGHQPAGRTLS